MQRYEHLKALIRTIPNFPRRGIMFRDVTTLLLHPEGFRDTIQALCADLDGQRLDKIVAIESRGFILGGAMAEKLGRGLVLARKKGKLPGATTAISYDLEYGTDTIEIHTDAIASGEHVLVVDDLLATGGTCAAVCKLVEKLGGKVIGCRFIVNLPELKGDKVLQRYAPRWLVEFDGA